MYNTTQIGLLLAFANPGLRGCGQVGGGVPSGFRGLCVSFCLGLLISAQPSPAELILGEVMPPHWLLLSAQVALVSSVPRCGRSGDLDS